MALHYIIYIFIAEERHKIEEEENERKLKKNERRESVIAVFMLSFSNRGEVVVGLMPLLLKKVSVDVAVITAICLCCFLKY